jgi:hypothetical protein
MNIEVQGLFTGFNPLYNFFGGQLWLQGCQRLPG